MRGRHHWFCRWSARNFQKMCHPKPKRLQYQRMWHLNKFPQTSSTTMVRILCVCVSRDDSNNSDVDDINKRALHRSIHWCFVFFWFSCSIGTKWWEFTRRNQQSSCGLHSLFGGRWIIVESNHQPLVAIDTRIAAWPGWPTKASRSSRKQNWSYRLFNHWCELPPNHFRLDFDGK